MRILVIRHGESEADILNVHEGRADFNLTEKGNRQASAMDFENFSVLHKETFPFFSNMPNVSGIP